MYVFFGIILGHWLLRIFLSACSSRSNGLYTVPLCSKYTRALVFEKFGRRIHVSRRIHVLGQLTFENLLCVANVLLMCCHIPGHWLFENLCFVSSNISPKSFLQWLLSSTYARALTFENLYKQKSSLQWLYLVHSEGTDFWDGLKRSTWLKPFRSWFNVLLMCC
jgi:hypothetical protein